MDIGIGVDVNEAGEEENGRLDLIPVRGALPCYPARACCQPTLRSLEGQL